MYRCRRPRELMLCARQLADFFRFGVKYVEDLYAQQPPRNTAGSWKSVFTRSILPSPC
jgi:hypothetical protein